MSIIEIGIEQDVVYQSFEEMILWIVLSVSLAIVLTCSYLSCVNLAPLQVLLAYVVTFTIPAGMLDIINFILTLSQSLHASAGFILYNRPLPANPLSFPLYDTSQSRLQPVT
jgi:hypothetical protein